jgi:hypothetical protein
MLAAGLDRISICTAQPICTSYYLAYVMCGYVMYIFDRGEYHQEQSSYLKSELEQIKQA